MAYDIKKMSEQDKINLTFSVMNIMQSWALSDQEQMRLLDLPASFKPRTLYLYRGGDKAFDYTQNIINRAEMLIGIYDSLSTTYPVHKEYGVIWLKRPVKKFAKQTPLSLMLSSEAGMRRVWHFLDCTQTWD